MIACWYQRELTAFAEGSSDWFRSCVEQEEKSQMSGFPEGTARSESERVPACNQRSRLIEKSVTLAKVGRVNFRGFGGFFFRYQFETTVN